MITDAIKNTVTRLWHARQVRLFNEGIANSTELNVTYQKDSGEVIRRTVHPYEIKAHRTSGRLMAYVTDDAGGSGQIKSYAASGIRKIAGTDTEFEPEDWEE